MNILQEVIKLFAGDDTSVDWLKLPKKRLLKKLTERELLTLESEVGAKLFGPIPSGHRREFFCLDERTWIWHEEWFDSKHKLTTSTVRYEISEQGVLKVQEGARYAYLEGQELQNFGIAIRMYYEQVARQVYKRDPATGQSLVQ